MSTSGPLGDFRAALDGLETLVVNSAHFQTVTGAVDAAAARAFVFWPGQQPFTVTKTGRKKEKKVWPAVYARVDLGEGASLDLSVSEGGGCYVPDIPLTLQIWRTTPANEISTPKVESQNFLQMLGILLREMAALSHSETNLYVGRFQVDRVFKNDETSTDDDFMMGQISVFRRGS